MMVPPPRLERGTSRSTILWTTLSSRFPLTLSLPNLLQISVFNVPLLSGRFLSLILGGDLVAI